MTSSPTARMDRKVGRVRRPTSSAGSVDAPAGKQASRWSRVCVLAMIAIWRRSLCQRFRLAPPAHGSNDMPSKPRRCSRPIATRRSGAARRCDRDRIPTPCRSVPASTGASSAYRGRHLRCHARRPMQSIVRPAATIRYFASGMSCGGVVALTRDGVGYEVRVNWLTGGVEVVPINLL